MNFFSSDDSSYDSDLIDSEIEADLYSSIHYQQETSLTDAKEFNTSTINEYSIQEKPETHRSNSPKHPNRTILNNSDKTGKNCNANLSQNSKNYIEVQTIEYKNQLNNRNLTKRKSSVVSDLLNNIQSKTKRGKICTTNKKNKISECNVIASEDTSDDDDSDIIYIDSKGKEKQFQTNLSNLTITLDSSSDSDDSWYHRLSNRSSISFSNRNSKDLWYINNDDMYRFRRKSNRYHESDLANCGNCNEKGHFAKDCSVSSVKKCYICGNKHNPVNCKKRTCSNCFRMGHDCRFCKFGVRTCRLCNMNGHPSEECPDLWRRYHFTTSNKGIQTSRPFRNAPIFCYNCGISGHFGGNCIKTRMNMTSFKTWPLVINYVAPFSTFQPQNSMLNKSFIDFEENTANKLISKSKKRKQKKILKHAKKKTFQTQQNDFPRTSKTEIAAQNTKKKALANQQNDFLRTPKTEIVEQKTPDIIAKFLALPDFTKKQKKQIAKEEKHLRKMEILREKILAQSNNISIPLLDLSGRKKLPFSYKSLKNRAKKERRLLRKLISETCSSNNNISASQVG